MRALLNRINKLEDSVGINRPLPRPTLMSDLIACSLAKQWFPDEEELQAFVNWRYRLFATHADPDKPYFKHDFTPEDIALYAQHWKKEKADRLTKQP